MDVAFYNDEHSHKSMACTLVATESPNSHPNLPEMEIIQQVPCKKVPQTVCEGFDLFSREPINSPEFVRDIQSCIGLSWYLTISESSSTLRARLGIHVKEQ